MLVDFPVSKDVKALEFPHFPTRHQAFVWRNWGLVPAAKLATVLGATEGQVRELAEGMGLDPSVTADPLWLQRGYITVIRANWHLLPYEQLLELMDWSPEKLAFTLKEDDFLWAKLGYLKPEAERVRYRALSEDEERRTAKLRETLARYFPENASRSGGEKPFAFLQENYRQRATPPALPKAGRRAGTDEVRLDERWTVRYPAGNRRLREFAERFVRDVETGWGFRLAAAEAGEDGAAEAEAQVIAVRVVSNQELPAESHRIEVAGSGIVVTAVDEAGVLRGLQWLKRQMNSRGGPYLLNGTAERRTRFDLRYIYSYSALYGDPLLEPELDPYPDALLKRLSDMGVNGIWMQCVLYSLIPWKGAPELSAGWERRLESLRAIVERAASFGIGVYLYYNEPRAMPLSFFDRHPEWKGHVSGNEACLCTSNPEVLGMLKDSTARLFAEVPGLAGLFTITMSENLTNCYSRAPNGETNCPRCSKRPIEEVVSEVNRTIAEGATGANPKARIVCWNWGWTEWLGWQPEMIRRAIRQLPEGVGVMSTSEEGMQINIGGVPGSVVDYSMSIIGPGEKASDCWRTANESGLASVAKVQFNTTWECSAVPFLPVPDLVETHLKRLRQSGVTGLMLSWTLGGYPSMNLELASEYYWDDESDPDSNPDSDSESRMGKVLETRYGSAAASRLAHAFSAFSRAFKEFPFHVGVAYLAPQNMGPANLLHAAPSGFKATMVGIPYDDLDGWRSIYPEDVFADQFGKLSRGWHKGLKLLDRVSRFVPSERLEEYESLRNAALGAYLHFHSAYLQIRFVMRRNRMLRSRSERMKALWRGRMRTALLQELETAIRLHELIESDARIGFEATNHYYYTANDLKEKVLNCTLLLESLDETAAVQA